MPATKPRKVGCEGCRARHVKCEGGLPCVRCKRQKLECKKASRITFRQASILGRSRSGFPAQQIWCSTSNRKLDFVDQTLETNRHYEDEDGHYSEGSQEEQPSYNPPQDSTHGREPLPSFDNGDVAALEIENSIPDVTVVDTRSGSHSRSTSDTSVYPLVRLRPHSSSPLAPITGFSPPITDYRPQFEPALPLVLDLPDLVTGDQFHTVKEDHRKILESFFDVVGPSIDPCDQYGTLASEIIERALLSPQLLSPVLQLGEIEDINMDSLSHMSPEIDVLAFSGADTLSAVYLYRLMDNIRGSIGLENSLEFAEHIRDAIKNINLYSEEDSQLLHQVIWASLRQEIFLAIMYNETACLELKQSSLSNLQSSCDDERWTNQIFLQLISALRYCFGDNKSSTVYDELVADLARWMQDKPKTFEPIFFQSPQVDKQFPEVLLLNDYAAAASQYYHIIRILLIAHNPRMPRLGPAKRNAAKWRDDQVKGDVRIVCAIAVSRGDVNPMYLNSCMAIALAGDKFSDALERKLLLDILVKTQTRYRWSTLTAQDYLKDFWQT